LQTATAWKPLTFDLFQACSVYFGLPQNAKNDDRHLSLAVLKAWHSATQ
jgi:hypothetical protein